MIVSIVIGMLFLIVGLGVGAAALLGGPTTINKILFAPAAIAVIVLLQVSGIGVYTLLMQQEVLEPLCKATVQKNIMLNGQEADAYIADQEYRKELDAQAARARIRAEEALAKKRVKS